MPHDPAPDPAPKAQPQVALVVPPALAFAICRNSLNVVRLEGIWEGIESCCTDPQACGMADTDTPVWDEVTLHLAKVVGGGIVTVTPPDDVAEDWTLAIWFADLRRYFPQIHINLPPALAATATEGSREFLDRAEGEAVVERTHHLAVMREIMEYAEAYEAKIRTQETVHDALDAYVRWRHEEHRDVGGTTTDTGIKQGEPAVRVKAHVKDMPLSEFGLDEIHALFDYWRKRHEQNKRNSSSKPFSRSLCKNTNTVIKDLFRWLQKGGRCRGSRPRIWTWASGSRSRRTTTRSSGPRGLKSRT